MALYIRVMNGFWNHRKTVKLRTILGDDAFWIMPRIWSYAAENQPDGDFSKYTTEELSVLIGAVKHPSSIRQALLDVGYMDKDGRLHDWDDWNGYHAAFAARAKIASDARWKGKDKKRKDKTGAKQCLTDACSIPAVLNTLEFLQTWEAWKIHLKEKKSKTTQSAFQKQLEKCASLGIPEAIRWLNYAIEHSWQGLYEPHMNHAPMNQTPVKRIPTAADMDEADKRRRQREIDAEAVKA